MQKESYIRKAESLLKDVNFYRASLDYYRSVADCAEDLRLEESDIVKKERFLSGTINAVENAMSLLNDTERAIVTSLYFDKSKTFDDVCDECALERSSVYRYRSSALKKIAKAIYGAE